MAITREKKEAQIAALKTEFARSSMIVLTSYKGLSVKDAEGLRAELKAAEGNFRVVKNAMLVRAAADTYAGVDLSDIEGPIAVAFGYADQVMPAKTVVDYAKKRGTLQPIGAINSLGERFDADQVRQLAELPSREQLTAQLVGTIAAPLSGFVRVLGGNLRGLVTALDGIAKAKEAS